MTFKICEYCKEKFYPTGKSNDRFKEKKFCNHVCYINSCRRPLSKTCEHCGETFHRKSNQDATTFSLKKYCCRACYDDSRRRKDKKCVECGKVFSPRHVRRKLCSITCARKAQKKGKERVEECPTCKKKFKVVGANRKYCSRKCYIDSPTSWRNNRIWDLPELWRFDEMWSDQACIGAGGKGYIKTRMKF